MPEIAQEGVGKLAFLRGGGEMGRLTRDHDWSASELGEPADWPQSLKITLAIILNSKFPMFLWWGPNLLCFYNDAYRPSLGNNGKHPKILGMPAVEAWSEIWDFISPLIRQISNGSDSVFYEDLLVPILRNGKKEDVYWTFSYSPVCDESGLIAGVLVTCNETTHKVELLRHLRESEERFQNLIRDAAVGVVVLIGPEMKVEICNTAYGRLIDKEPQQLIGRPIFDVIPEAALDFHPIMRAVFTTGQPVTLHEYPYRVSKNKEQVVGHLNLIYQPYREESGEITGVIVLCQDVSEQVATQKKMETALEQLRLSREAAQLGLFDMDLIKGTMEWDRRCRTLFGIAHNEQVTYEHDFVKGLHPDDRERITAIISGLYLKESGGEYDVEYRTIGADDGRIRWVRAVGQVYFDGRDRAIRFIGSVLDITHQKINEQRKNDFIAMVSHELKTPLTSLTGYIQFLLREFQPEKDGLQYDLLERAGVQAKKMAAMINGFLNLSRFESGKLQLHLSSFSINELVIEVIADLTAALPHAQIGFSPSAPIAITADREKINSVINNLLSNAMKYSPKNADILVSCEHLAEMVFISVMDKGIGIKAEDLPYIFDRFYRVDNPNTKDISGFGIGLYLSAEIVRLHGGRIWAESEYGRGSTFHFCIPVKG